MPAFCLKKWKASNHTSQSNIVHCTFQFKLYMISMGIQRTKVLLFVFGHCSIRLIRIRQRANLLENDSIHVRFVVMRLRSIHNQSENLNAFWVFVFFFHFSIKELLRLYTWSIVNKLKKKPIGSNEIVYL